MLVGNKLAEALEGFQHTIIARNATDVDSGIVGYRLADVTGKHFAIRRIVEDGILLLGGIGAFVIAQDNCLRLREGLVKVGRCIPSGGVKNAMWWPYTAIISSMTKMMMTFLCWKSGFII